MTVNSTYASSGCPENTEWDGNNCTEIIDSHPVITKSSKKNNDKKVQQAVILVQDKEIIKESIIEKSVKEIQNPRISLLEQKMERDKNKQSIPTRDNYYFKLVKEWSVKNAESSLDLILNNHGIQNPDFGKNTNPVIVYKERLNRNEDPVFQSQIILEQNLANEKFLKLWGNFTTH